MSATATLERFGHTMNSIMPVASWEEGVPIRDSLAEWPGAPFLAESSEPYDDTMAVVVLSARQYPAWRELWDNPEDSAYDQFLLDL